MIASTDFGYTIQTTEYDANSALSELDRALRSNNIGEKAELIVRVPTYFEKYPFPIFVNAVLLKLTELFKNSSTNFLRKLILQVAERSQTHLDKIISRDEIAKRILVVSYSNDHIARALTLRFLGYLSNILSERKEIHHLIRTGLDSNDFTELDASIFAAELFASRSKEFANSIAGKILEMLSSMDVPSTTKVRILPILQHVHNDPHTTQKVFEICSETLKSSDNCLILVCSALKTLTRLSLSSLIIVESQIDYLYSILDSEYPFVVKKAALMCLSYIAKNAAHFLNDSHFLKSLEYAQKLGSASKSEAKLLLLALGFMSDLANSKLVMTWSNFDKIFNSLTLLVNKNMFLYRNDSYSILSRISAVSANLMLNMDQSSNNQALTVDFLIRFLPAWNWPEFEPEASPDPATKMLLHSLIKICSRYPQFSIRVGEAIFSAARIIPTCYSKFLAEIFCALNDCDHRIITKIGCEFSAKYANLSPYITILIDDDIPGYLENQHDPWILYKLARFASRHAKHRYAGKAFESLLDKTYSDTNYSWLKFLVKFSAVEARVTSRQFSIESIISSYASALNCLTIMNMDNNARCVFVHDYVSLRIEQLKLLELVSDVCRVNVSTSCSTEDDFPHLNDEISNYIRILADNLIQKYESLLINSFDADPHSLRHLTLEKTKIIFVKRYLDCLMGLKSFDMENILITENSSDNYCNKDTVAFLNDMGKDFNELVEADNSEVPFYKAIETIVALIYKLIRRPLYVPRYFYQALQSTTVKLVVSPQPSSTGDQSISLMPGQKLVLKVEGIVETNGTKPVVVRRISKVQLMLCTEFSDISCMDEKGATIGQKLVAMLTPHNNYFSTEFVLTFPKSGSLKVNVRLIDNETSHLWTTNVEERLKIKCLTSSSNSNSSLSSNLNAKYSF